MVILIAALFLFAAGACASAFSGWLIMLSAGILNGAGVIPASLGFVDSFWLGVIFVTFATLFMSPNAVK